ncbi:hypothetical protein DL98DRAFT_591038 [Cadophora sp. DSE1049]|nr:hypothetical protein DL98DRAFT_591038 [Cadophora sp. DSE1049]
MSFFGAAAARDGAAVAIATDGEFRDGAVAAVATHGRSRDGVPITRVDAVYAERATTPGGRHAVGFKVATFIEQPIPYVDPRDGQRYHVLGAVRMVNYHAGSFSYDDHNLGPVRQVHPRLALEEERRENDRGRAIEYDRSSQPSPRRSRSRDYHTARTSHTSRPTKKPTPAPAPKPKAPLVPIPAKFNKKGALIWDDSVHDAWKCDNWEDFAMEAAHKERETAHDMAERPWAHEIWCSENWEELAMNAAYKERDVARGKAEGPWEAPFEPKGPAKKGTSKGWN